MTLGLTPNLGTIIPQRLKLVTNFQNRARATELWSVLRRKVNEIGLPLFQFSSGWSQTKTCIHCTAWNCTEHTGLQNQYFGKAGKLFTGIIYSTPSLQYI
ncbi:hypothetical protein I79_013995 [Cricetulus griseus]|uniref:Uncharacterized protein n=1 Tax=Cricetulus griseus TaxID=10029 RepID=G3HSZ5_CRIGR|nr:hypothetical protein I79_013995 [Cricetulus griseus]